MSVICHQAVADYFQLKAFCVSIKLIQICFTFHIIVKHTLATITTLSNMVRESRNYIKETNNQP